MWSFIAVGILLFFILLCLLASVPLIRRHPLKEVRTPAEFGLEFEPVGFSTKDHILLKGYWIPAAGSARTVIMLHGYAGSLDPDLKYTPRLHKAGFNVLIFDFRAHGRSGGRITSMGARERADVIAAVNFAKNRSSKWIGLLGFSMGGRAALLAASMVPEVRAVISDGGPLRLATAAVQDLHLRKVPIPVAYILSGMMLVGASIISGVNLFKTDPFRQAKHLRGIPILFINGEQDLYTARSEMEKVLRDTGPSASLWSVPEARHRNIEKTRPDEYLERVIDFLEKQSAQIKSVGEDHETH